MQRGVNDRPAHDGTLRGRGEVARDDADRRGRRRRMDDPGRGRQTLLDGRGRFEGGTPEVPGGHARRYEQAKPQRIE
jgi:hypothetical protein